MIERLPSNRRIVNWLIPIVIFSVFWTSVLIYSGTLASGFHFIDDHEMIRISADLEDSNFLQVGSEWILRDFGLRFRPVYYAHRILSVQLLGTNFLLLSIQNLVLAITTSWLLYLFSRNLKLKSAYSYLFVFAGLVGTQAAIWWRLGPNETIGLFLFAFGLYALSKSYVIKSSRLFYKRLSLVLIVLASLCKESFIMMIPLVVFLNLYLSHERSELNKKLTLWQTIRLNKWFISILSVVFLIEGFFVMFVVGANQIGYAGGDANSLSPVKILATFRSLALDSNWQLLLIAALAYLVVLGTYHYTNRKLPIVKLQILAVTLLGFLVAVGPQLVLYAKSGIYERYLIPGTLAFAFLLAFLAHQSISFFSDKRIQRLLLGLLFLVGLFFLYPKFKTMLVFAQQFAGDGRTINAALTSVKTNSAPDDNVVIVAEPMQNFEEGYSLKNYLEIEQDKSNLYFEVVSSNPEETNLEGLTNGFINFLQAKHVSKVDTSDVKLVFVFGNIEDKFIASSTWFKASDYERFGFAKYVVYVKAN